MTILAVKPWRSALREARYLPSALVGPVLFLFIAGLASICLRMMGVVRIGFVS